jgi:hypothetical protein
MVVMNLLPLLSLQYFTLTRQHGRTPGHGNMAKPSVKLLAPAAQQWYWPRKGLFYCTALRLLLATIPSYTITSLAFELCDHSDNHHPGDHDNHPDFHYIFCQPT